MSSKKDYWMMCNREELLNAIGLLMPIVPKKTPKPVLESILFDVKEDGLSIMATDLEVGAKVIIKPEFYSFCGEPFKFLLMAEKVYPILKEEECAEINFRKLDETFFEIQAEENRYKIFSLHHTEYPDFDNFLGNTEASFSLPSNVFKDIIDKVVFSAAKEATRYTMNSILLEFDKNVMNFVGTDGKRLARYAIKMNKDFNTYSLFPLKSCEVLIKYMGQIEDTIDIYIKDNIAKFQTENFVMFARLLQGSYPPYNKVIPDYSEWKSISFERDALEKALKKSVLLTTQDSKSVKFSFFEGKLNIYSNDPNIGEANIKISADIPKDFKLDVSFNPVYFLDALRHWKDQERCEIYLMGNNTPAVLRFINGYEYVVMPLNS